MSNRLKSEDEIRTEKVKILNKIFDNSVYHDTNHTITDKMLGFVEDYTNGPRALTILQQPQSAENLQKLAQAAVEFKKISPNTPITK